MHVLFQFLRMFHLSIIYHIFNLKDWWIHLFPLLYHFSPLACGHHYITTNFEEIWVNHKKAFLCLNYLCTLHCCPKVQWKNLWRVEGKLWPLLSFFYLTKQGVKSFDCSFYCLLILVFSLRIKQCKKLVGNISGKIFS